MIKLSISRVQDYMDTTLVDCSNYVFKFFMKVVILCQMEIETDFTPLGPHDMGFIKIEPYNSLLVLLVSLDMMPPKTLFHQTLDELMVVSNSHLILVECCHLTQYQVILCQG